MRKLGPRRATRRLGFLSGFALLAGCSAIVDTSLTGGIGAQCASDSDCHAAACAIPANGSVGLCVKNCTSDIDCPRPSRCIVGQSQSGGALCQLELPLAAFYIGVGTSDAGWSLTHQQGLAYAQTQLGYVAGATMPANGVTWAFSNFVYDTDIPAKADEAVENGARVIVANSFSQRDAVLKIAPQYVDRGVTFLTCAGFAPQPNVGSYFGHMEQAWYVAGRLAAIRAQRSPPRLGIVASYITPEVVRHINAFTLGARSHTPESVVEVRYLGFWYDDNDTPTWNYKASFMSEPERLYGEELLAAKLIESGCEIISHQADSQRLNKAVDRWLGKGLLSANSVYTLANDNQFGCYQFQGSVRGDAYRNCIGAVYWNWGPMYQNLLDSLHRGVYQPANLMYAMSANKALSIVGFEPTPNQGVDESALAATLEATAKSGPDSVYRGPYATTGQRAAVQDGETIRYDPENLGPQEWRSMCWFVKGVVEKSDPANPLSADIDAQVPDGTQTPSLGISGRVLLSPPGLAAGAGLDCQQNF